MTTYKIELRTGAERRVFVGHVKPPYDDFNAAVADAKAWAHEHARELGEMSIAEYNAHGFAARHAVGVRTEND